MAKSSWLEISVAVESATVLRTESIAVFNSSNVPENQLTKSGLSLLSLLALSLRYCFAWFQTLFQRKKSDFHNPNKFETNLGFIFNCLNSCSIKTLCSEKIFNLFKLLIHQAAGMLQIRWINSLVKFGISKSIPIGWNCNENCPVQYQQ